jgi:hypothetical protein
MQHVVELKEKKGNTVGLRLYPQFRLRFILLAWNGYLLAFRLFF